MTKQYIVVLWDSKKTKWVYPLSVGPKSGGWYLRIFSKQESAEAFIETERMKTGEAKPDPDPEPAEHYQVVPFDLPEPLGHEHSSRTYDPYDTKQRREEAKQRTEEAEQDNEDVATCESCGNEAILTACPECMEDVCPECFTTIIACDRCVANETDEPETTERTSTTVTN